MKCFKDENPEKRLLLDQLSSNGSNAEKVDQKAVLGQKQPEKKRKRLLSSDEDDFALDTIVQSKVRKESSEKSKKSSSEDSSKKVQKKSSEEEKENRPKEKQPEVPKKEPKIEPKIEPKKEPEKVPEVVKEPEIVKVPAKIGHAIDPKINSVTQVDIGEAPKRSGITFEYSQTIGHRIVQLSEHSIDVQIKVQGRFKRIFIIHFNSWLLTATILSAF